MSPALRDITSKVENNYYMFRSIKEEKVSIQEPEIVIKEDHHNSTISFRQSPLKHFFSSTMPREGKMRTFEMKKTDTICNPEGEKEKGKRIVHTINRSP